MLFVTEHRHSTTIIPFMSGLLILINVFPHLLTSRYTGKTSFDIPNFPPPLSNYSLYTKEQHVN